VQVEADEVSGLPAAVEVAAYRIVSEALTNVGRHAAATACSVTLRVADGELAVQVRDDGDGIAEDVVAGVGLRSMRERVDELGGRYEVGCPPQGGTSVRAWLPMAQGRA
jgi:signal transduction histidine kinase